MPHTIGPNRKELTLAELTAEVRYMREKMHRMSNFMQALDEKVRKLEKAQAQR